MNEAKTRAPREEGNRTDHPSPSVLFCYLDGEVTGGSSAEFQDHVVGCPSCLHRLREASDFRQAVAQGPKLEMEDERERAWTRLANRLDLGAPAPSVAVAPPFHGPRQGMPTIFRARNLKWLRIAAAGLFGVVLGWAGSLGWLQDSPSPSPDIPEERQAKAALVQTQLHEAESRIQGQEDQIQELQESLAATQADLSAAQLQNPARPRGTEPPASLPASPQAVARDLPAVATLLSARPAFTLRSRATRLFDLTSSGTIKIVLPESGDGLVVRVDLRHFRPFPELLFALRDEEGRALDSRLEPGTGLHGDAGTLLTLGGLTPGNYSLEVTGLPAVPDVLPEVYELRVSGFG